MKNRLLRCVFVFGALFLPTFASAQTEPATVSVVGIKESITVRRDARSIPYIEATNDADLYFMQGFVTASDRLWQMDLLRRVARGETAEIFGKQTLNEDKRWRKLGFARVAQESLQYLNPELRIALENYAKGVNAYTATLDEKSLPVEFKILQYKPREWTPADTIVIGKILAEALSSTYTRDLLRESTKGLDPAKLADLNNQVTPFDVVLFGKDNPIRTASGSDQVNFHEVSDSKPKRSCSSCTSLLQNYSELASNEERIRRSSLERIGFYSEELAASNNWVISGKRTADGKPILANDPHLLASAPGIWYLSHLSTPTMRVSGVTFPGVPGIVLGHNENIAWGATNVGPDVQDLYLETFGADGKYKTPAGFADPIIRKEEIKVRVNPFKTDVTTEILEVVETRNGPIIADVDGKKYALKWTALDAKNSDFEAFFNVNRAKDWNDFTKAFKTYGGATQNFVYADIKGNIGWYAAGRIPIRKTGDGAFPYDGSTNEGEWTGFIPFEELPHLYNPPEGFIVTANQRIVGTSYKYQQMSRDASSPWRARRIYELLKANSKVTMDDVSNIQLDSFNRPLSNLAKKILELEAATPENIASLKSWDGKMTPDSRAALLANEIRVCGANKMAEDNQPAPAYIIRERVFDRVIGEKTSIWLPKKYASFAAMLKECDTESSAAFTRRYGSDAAKWVWGSSAQSNFPHPLAVAPLIGGQFATPKVGLSGSGQTPNVGSYVSMRHIASPGNWDATRHVIPLGQSGNPQSPNYKDQFESWRTGSAAVFPFTKPAVEAATKSTLVAVPR
ncbi:MAG: penicillin acylase family protein [Saprospiraceae bacterium]|nr:penicillin acylase family protein [Pyrinomonadaceae bacterium]